jgi:glycosyltransferase involved in cell wall biosynthesis
LPVWNGLPYVREAVASVQSQTLAAWELIVVDDGSTDGTLEWLRTLNDARVRIIEEPHTGNLSRVRNIGHAAARSDWIAILDADDIFEPLKLEHQLAYHRAHPQHRWSYTGRKLIDARGGILPDENFSPFVAIGGWVLLPLLVHDAKIASTTMMVERALLEEVGGLAENHPLAGDYDLRLRLAARSECGVLDEPLTRIRQHPASMSTNNPSTVAGLANVYRDFRRWSPLPEATRRARAQEAFYRMKLARQRFDRGEWWKGWQALLIAVRQRPLDSRAYRGAARGLVMMMQHRLGPRA